MSVLYKVLMFGDREWGDIKPVEKEIRKLIRKHGKDRLLIISGKAPGADTLSCIAAHRLSVHVAEVGALWETRYRGAGPQRNEMMKLMEPDEAIGFHPAIEKSRGTKDMAKRLDRAGIPYKIIEK